MGSDLKEVLKTSQSSYSSSEILSSIVDYAANDADFAALFDAADDLTQSPLLVLGAIQSVLIANPDEPLAGYFATLGGHHQHKPRSFWPTLKEFAVHHDAILVERIRRRKVIVKSDIRRTVALRALVSKAWDSLGRPKRYALIDLGCGIGLNLMLDRLDLQVETRNIVLRLPDGVRATVEVTEGSVPVMDLPRAERRVGIDRYKLDVESATDRNWLLGSIMPENVGAMAALRAGLSCLSRDPPSLVIGDAPTALANVLADIEPGLAVIVMHSMMIHYLSLEDRQRVNDLILASALRRPTARVAMEIAGPAATLETFVGPTQERKFFGRAEFDGAWVRWVASEE